MKLYYMPAACSLAAQIAMHELKLEHELVKVEGKGKTLPDGGDFLAINPRGQVPVLELDDGTLLTEGPVILQYLADRVPANAVMPPAGTMERYRVLEWLNYITSELHQRYYSLFIYAHLPDEAQQTFRADLDRRFDYVSSRLGDRTWLMGDTFTVADGYLFVMLRWTSFFKIDLGHWPNLVAYRDRMLQRPTVMAAMRDAGLVKTAAPAPG